MAPRKLLPVCASTDRAAWESAWKAALPRLRAHCLRLARDDADMAGDLVGEVGFCLCRRHAEGRLACRDLSGYACRLATLRWRSACRNRAYRAGRLRRAADFIRRCNGVKVGASAESAAEDDVGDMGDRGDGVEKDDVI